MSQTIIIKDIDFNRINYLVGMIKNKKQKDNSFLSMSRNEKLRILKFLESKRFVLKMVDSKLIIENIVLNGEIKIKDASNRLSRTIENKFNISKTYVATAKKGIVSNAKTFYTNMKEIKETVVTQVETAVEVKPEKPKLVFDISKETNLMPNLNENTEEKVIVTKEPEVKEEAVTNVGEIVRNNHELNLKADFCQRINEGNSLVMKVDSNNMNYLRNKFGLISEKAMQMPNSKKLVKSKTGSVSTIFLATLAASIMAIISRFVTTIITK